MNRTEFVEALADHTKQAKTHADQFLRAFQAIIIEQLQSGEKVALVGFGTFQPQHRKATTGVNPATKEKINIPAKTVAKLKFSDTVNQLL